MSWDFLKTLIGLIVLLVVTLASLTSVGYLFAVAFGVLEVDAQPVAIVALLTVVGLFVASVGWTQILMLAQRADRDGA